MWKGDGNFVSKINKIKLVACRREHMAENTNRAIRWWGLPCSNFWPLKSEAKLFSKDVPQDWWRVVRLSWGFRLLSFGNSQFFWEQLLLKMKLSGLNLPWRCQQKKSNFFMQSLSYVISERKKNIFCLYAFTPEKTILNTWKCYFWSVTDYPRRWNITLKEQLGSTPWGLLYMLCTPLQHRRTLGTWKNRSLHNGCPFLTGILSHAQSIVSFTKGSTFLFKAWDGLLHLVTKKTDFWNKIFHNHLLNEHFDHLYLCSTASQETETGLSLSRLPLSQPLPFLNTTGDITMTTILSWGMVTNLQVVPQLAGRRRKETRALLSRQTAAASVSSVSPAPSCPLLWDLSQGRQRSQRSSRADLVLSDALLLELSTEPKSFQPLMMTGAD